MLATSEVPCPGCKLKTKIAYRPPRLLEPAIVPFTCQDCESDCLAKVMKPKSVEKLAPGSVTILTKITRPSKLLIDMLHEEQQLNRKEETP